MRRYAVFLRAVTPTGKNRVPMAALREVLLDAGLVEVRTYIQSGNVVARADGGRHQLERRVHDVVAEHIGPDLVVIARPANRIRQILADVPFGDADRSRVHITLLATRPTPERVGEMLDVDLGGDRIEVRGDTVYALYEEAEGRSRFNLKYFERSLGVSGTTRGLNTMSAIARLMDDVARS